MMSSRQTVKKSRISDLVSARFFEGSREEMKPNFVITRFGDSISRAKIVGTVTEKFVKDDRKFGSLSVDDGTGAINVRVFSDGLKLIEGVNAGELVSVVGKVRSYNDEIYVSPDFVKRLDDPNYEPFFRLEILNSLADRKKAADELRRLRDQTSEEELEDYASQKYGIGKDSLQVIVQSKQEQVDYGPMMLELIGRLDEGSGVEISVLLKESKLEEGLAESVVSDLIAAGEVYEPTVGKLKRV